MAMPSPTPNGRHQAALVILVAATVGAGNAAHCGGRGAGSCAGSGAARGVLLIQKRSSFASSALSPAVPCHTAVPGERCYNAVVWAKQHGVKIHPSWYPGLTPISSFEEFQQMLHQGGHGIFHNGTANYAGCRPPCGINGPGITTTAPFPSPRVLDWTVHAATNCYPSKGAAVVPGPDPVSWRITAEQCKAACRASTDCTAFTVSTLADTGPCYLRTHVCLPKCDQSSNWLTYMPPEVSAIEGCDPQTSPQPSTSVPTAEPAPEPAPEPEPEATREPGAEPAPQPAPEHASEPTPEPGAEPAPEPAAGPAQEPGPAPVPGPAPEPGPEAGPEPTRAPSPAPPAPPVQATTQAPAHPTPAPSPTPTSVSTPLPASALTPASTPAPTPAPAPTQAPTPAPTAAPTAAPTLAPTPTPVAACHTAVAGERCHLAVTWAMHHGILIYPSWYPGLTPSSSFEDFQQLLHTGGHGPTRSGPPSYADCRQPCAAAPSPHPGPSPGLAPAPPPRSPNGLSPWRASGSTVGSGWCEAEVPQAGWNLFRHCGDLQMTVLTYNLFWWNLFGVRGGNGGSAGKLIAENGPFDVMGFQECGDAHRVLADAGLDAAYGIVDKGHGLAMAYNKSAWEELGAGSRLVAEDRQDEYYGTRAVSWARLRHASSGTTVLFLNHHGPLPIDSGGRCGPQATAYGLLRIAGTEARAGDRVILVGDLNAAAASSTQRTLQGSLQRVVAHWVDAIFTSCPGGTGKRLGTGGSDHEALEARLVI
mmetsp:Transcript_90642/g.252089  ORF Transcript_90642/g.252089 Transcript_90642/m.252089 type:complete len:759 (+) Transcript_90642:86-2362(+)